MSLPLAHPACGAVRGIRTGQVSAWLGIPYAQPPVGTRRFLAPARARAWHDVRDARQFGQAAVQRHVAVVSKPFLGPSVGEDCLSLNIWSPAADGAKRPVMVWIHGGAFILGSARIYDGAQLAETGDMVVVTMNYRMGALGFVNFRGLTGDTRFASNPGLRDVMLALQWVRTNIEAFGGDPAQVTLAGSSAGSIMASLLMASDEAAQLFDGVILQSGTYDLVHSQEKSLAVAQAYLDVLEIQNGPDTLEKLQALDATKLLSAQAAVQRRLPGVLATVPWFDGELVPASIEAARSKTLRAMPMLAGVNRDETRMFELVPGPDLLPLKRDALTQFLRLHVGEESAAQVLALYPDQVAGNRQLATDLEFLMPTLQLAERHAEHSPTWLYRFDATHPMLGGAVHGLELSYLWNWTGALAMMARGGALTGDKAALAESMRAYWISFVRTGNPGTQWPAFNAVDRQTMVFDKVSQLVRDPDGARRAHWPMLIRAQ
ncbi:carboxylesterase/lipase family protein [Pigmentiphaga aceris]|uniref:Carboxylic ester hydrolase n=1 Tax=Pigmentiphaga aceris TaxID=1940612 RepID=A0A5C0AT88_9BURK|nr:carboxylesterase/lipase family protein [Pigmentiphaga aceris]QEI04493.1 carboxylesterase/lipase family protein [Pigmentiphaga aceris]